MNATELRIGNIIGMNLKEFPQNWFRVLEPAHLNMRVTDSWNQPDGKRFQTDFYDPEYMEGIPLNDDWFKMFGFGYRNENGYKYYHRYSKNVSDEVHISCENGEDYALLGDNDGGHHLITGLEIETVHQLQNLYFALTGEELTIKK